MKKLRIIVIVLIGILLVGGISAYATYTYLAKDVEYTKANGTKVSVENALNELYENKQFQSYDMLNSATITGTGYDFKKISLVKDIQNKMLYLKVEADVVVQDKNDTIEIDISGLNINEIVNWKICNFISTGDFRVSTSNFTKDTIKIGCDTNWGYATKYNYDYVVAIKYN